MGNALCKCWLLKMVLVQVFNSMFVSTQSHTNSCHYLKVPCVHPECGLEIKKADLNEHLEKECKYRLETCGFCKRQINLNKMKVQDLCC